MNTDKLFRIGSAARDTSAGAMARNPAMTRPILRTLVCWRLMLGATLVLSAAFAAFPIKAQDAAVFERGDAVVTGFSGTTQPDSAPTGNLLDETFIDLDGASAKIFKLESGAPPTAQVISAPPVFQIKAHDVGQVFAIGLDGTPSSASDSPNIYLGATSAFGLKIVLADSTATDARSV
jgi:hypothetical protein